MPLTTPSTIVGALIITVVTIAATVAFWRRWPRRGRLPLRAATLLLSQVLVIVFVGLLVNRSEELYPTLRTLIDPPTARNAAPETANTGSLDEWLTARSEQGIRTGLTFTWQPTGEGPWPWTEPPVVRLPPQYFEHTGSHFPVVVAITDTTFRAESDYRIADRHTDPAVVVFVHPTRTGAEVTSLLGERLPRNLEQDLRVFPDRWSNVGIGDHAQTAIDVVAAHPERYRAVAAVNPTAPHVLTANVHGLMARGTAVAVFLAAGVTGPSELPTMAIPPSTQQPFPTSQKRTEAALPAHTEPLSASLRWASGQLPPALEAPRTGGQLTHIPQITAPVAGATSALRDLSLSHETPR